MIKSFDLNQLFKSWFKSSNKNHDLYQAIKRKKHVVLELCVMSLTHLISILIGFHIAYIVGSVYFSARTEDGSSKRLGRKKANI